MAGNQFGKIIRVTTYGESHGEQMGVIIDGLPAGFAVSKRRIQENLDRRRPGGKIGPAGDTGTDIGISARNEADQVKIVSGWLPSREDRSDNASQEGSAKNYQAESQLGVTTGSPLCMQIPNQDRRSQDYDDVLKVFRPSHSDYTYYQKYGQRLAGGGRASARETVSRVAAGAVCQQILEQLIPQYDCLAFVDQIGKLRGPAQSVEGEAFQLRDQIRASALQVKDSDFESRALRLISEAKEQGDSLGGIIECHVKLPEIGIGQPVFDKLNAVLAYAMMSIPAARGIEFGSGFAGLQAPGSEQNDEMSFVEKQNAPDREISFASNNSGGIQAGLSNGQNIVFRVGFKPVSTIFKKQQTISINNENVSFMPRSGRHDSCVLPRAVPIVEAMVHITLADMYFYHRATARFQSE